MSRENVEIVRRWAEGWERLEWDAAEELVDPGVEQHGTVGGVEEGRAYVVSARSGGTTKKSRRHGMSTGSR